MVTPPHIPGPYEHRGAYQQHNNPNGIYQGPPPVQGIPPIVINNAASSSASAAAVAGGGYYRGRRRQSFWVHFWLLLFTAGLGNIAYALYVGHWNKVRGM